MAKKYNFDRLLSDEKERFCSWFCSGENGNDLIHALNSNSSKSEGYKIRRLDNSWWPHIYCIVLNDDDNPGKGRNRKDGVQWKYCKVGITEVGTTTGTHNRMETVQNQIKKNTGKEAEIIFVLPVDASDSRRNSEIEKSVRERIGLPVNQDLAEKHKFPVPTEWVITTQPYINKIVWGKANTAGALDTRFILGMPEFEQRGYLPPKLIWQNNEVVYQP
jgi:hypothetical protein